MDTVSTINKDSLTSCEATVVKLRLHGDKSLDLVTNNLTLNASIDFVLSSKHFDGPLR